MVCYASKYIGVWYMLFNSLYYREFVMSLRVIIYAKQNGAQMATFAATEQIAYLVECGREFWSSDEKRDFRTKQ